MIRTLLSLSFVLLFLGCSDKNRVEIDFFTIATPKIQNIEIIENTRNDGYIILEGDTLKYKRGFQIDNLAEPCPKIMYMPIKDSSYVPPNGFFISKNRNFDLDSYRKQNLKYTKIDGRNAKITYPIENEGVIGVYIDSLYYWTSSDLQGVAQFHIYGFVRDKNQKEIALSLESIEFKEK
ncbi:MAG: hypothetical protein ACJAZ3_001180 [Sphingobacteriales bacterium]|jgi:hypothetical protein